MKLRSLMYDAGCHVCSGIAKQAEAEARGWLRVKPLQDAEMRALLATHAPDLGRRPALVTQDGDRVTVDVGWKMIAKLGLGLGPLRSWRLLRLLAEGQGAAADAQTGARRHLLRSVGGGALASVAGMVMARPTGPAQDASPQLSDERRNAIVAAVRNDPRVQIAENKLLELGISRDNPNASVVRAKDGTLLTLMFFGDITGRPDRAGMVAHERNVDGSIQVFLEVVEADTQKLISPEGQLQEGVLNSTKAMTVGATGQVSPSSKAQYLLCMTSCLVGQCWDDLLACRRLIFLAAVLACMVLRCGQPAYVCHRGCRFWW